MGKTQFLFSFLDISIYHSVWHWGQSRAIYIKISLIIFMHQSKHNLSKSIIFFDQLFFLWNQIFLCLNILNSENIPYLLNYHRCLLLLSCNIVKKMCGTNVRKVWIIKYFVIDNELNTVTLTILFLSWAPQQDRLVGRAPQLGQARARV